MVKIKLTEVFPYGEGEGTVDIDTEEIERIDTPQEASRRGIEFAGDHQALVFLKGESPRDYIPVKETAEQVEDLRAG